MPTSALQFTRLADGERRSEPPGPEAAALKPSSSGARAFVDSADRIVAYLNAHTPLTDWSVSRVTGGEQIHVHVYHDRLLHAGDRIDWNESFCSRMAAGAAHVVRDARADPDYADLEAAERVGAYAGFTINDDRGQMFGVLCGVRPEALSDDERVDEQLIRLFSDLLSTQLRLSRTVDRERRRIALAEARAEVDALTGVLNRRGWDRVVADAQERMDSFGDPVAVAVVDLNGLKALNDAEGHRAGDGLIRRAAEVLYAVCGSTGFVARYGGDEFAILANGVVPSQAQERFAAFATALTEAGVSASLGFAAAEPGVRTLEQAVTAADLMMYEHKRRAKAE